MPDRQVLDADAIDPGLLDDMESAALETERNRQTAENAASSDDDYEIVDPTDGSTSASGVPGAQKSALVASREAQTAQNAAGTDADYSVVDPDTGGTSASGVAGAAKSAADAADDRLKASRHRQTAQNAAGTDADYEVIDETDGGADASGIPGAAYSAQVARTAADRAVGAANSIDEAGASTALRSVLALGAAVANEWPDAGFITKTDATVVQSTEGRTWTIPEGKYLLLDIPTAPVEAYNVTCGFVVLEGETRYLQARGTGSGASSVLNVLPAEIVYDGDPPLAYIGSLSETDFGGTNLTVRIDNPAGNGTVVISEPVLQYAPRLLVPFDLASALLKVRSIKVVSSATSLTKADSGKIIFVPVTAAADFTITLPTASGFNAKIVKHSTHVVTVAKSGGTVRGGDKLTTQYTMGDVVVLVTDAQTSGDFTT